MPGISASIIAQLKSATTQTVFNPISPGTADTEFSQALPNKTKMLIIKSRDPRARIQYTLTSGESGTKYVTIPIGTERILTFIDLSSATLYLQVNKSSTVIEIEAWN